jgi:heptosyltransferase-2
MKADKILLVLVAGLGDLIIAAPALKALRRRFPQSRITLLVEERVAAYARSCPWVDEVEALKSFDLRSWRSWRAHWQATLAVLVRLRRQRFDLAANLYEISSPSGRFKMFALFRVVAPRTSVGRNTCGRGSFFDMKIAEDAGGELCQGDYYAEIARVLGAEVDPKDKSSLWLDADAGTRAERYLSNSGISAQDVVIGFNPTSAVAQKRWPAQSCARLADMLAEACSAKIVFIGAACDAGWLREIATLMRSPSLQTAEALDLEAKIALVRRFRLLVTTHSAFMHVANSFSVPFLCLSIADKKDDPYQPTPGRFAIVRAAPGAQAGISSISVERAFDSAKTLLSPATGNGS